MASRVMSLSGGDSGGLVRSWTKTYSASDINNWVKSNLPAYSIINNVTFKCNVYKSASLSYGSCYVKVGASQIFSNDGDIVIESRGGLDINVSVKSFCQSATANAGCINDNIAVTIYHNTVVHTWYIKDVSLIFDYTPPICRVHTSVVGDGVANVGGTVSGGGAFEVDVEDKTVTLVATPASGYRFTHWGDGSKVAGYEPTINVVISQNDISAFETDKSYTAFFEKITYTIGVSAENGGTVSGGGTYEHGSNITLKAVPSAGYKFVKWSDGVTSASRSVTVTGDASYTAIFSPICVLYDSIFNFYRWVERGITSGRGTISNINDLGFTFTASVDDGYTGYSHMFAVEPGKKYTLEYDCSGGTSNQTFVFFHSTDGDYNWTKLADSALKKWSFTVPDGFYLASIRVDVNNKGETINYSNFRIYPADCDYMGNTLKAVDRFDSAKWSMPTPTRDCYIFQGWNTKADGSGKFYTQSDAYPTEDLILYSIWKADPPKISDVQLLYGGKVVSDSNKVPAGQSFILKCKLS